jgi:hypothetical protein
MSFLSLLLAILTLFSVLVTAILVSVTPIYGKKFKKLLITIEIFLAWISFFLFAATLYVSSKDSNITAAELEEARRIAKTANGRAIHLRAETKGTKQEVAKLRERQKPRVITPKQIEIISNALADAIQSPPTFVHIPVPEADILARDYADGVEKAVGGVRHKDGVFYEHFDSLEIHSGLTLVYNGTPLASAPEEMQRAVNMNRKAETIEAAFKTASVPLKVISSASSVPDNTFVFVTGLTP